ncbi:FxLYD domain-containing protein [Actinacidiphila glaucinigra]|uniref:FxLYD domain-containing protein n=1 Tax=Actinacidiphila glaucinigra TaxID=235986 RepID=UPI00382BA09F
MRTRIWLATAAVAAAAVLTGCSVPETSDSGKSDSGSSSNAVKDAAKDATKPATGNAPQKDVTLSKCGTDSFGQYPQADLVVKNHSSKSSNYIVQVEFTDAEGTRAAEGTAALNNLAPGQKANEKAVGLSKAPSGMKCRITKVTRYAAP